MYSLPDVAKVKIEPKTSFRAKAEFGGNRRTDIQLGGNVALLGIHEQFDIGLGDNLQKEGENARKSAEFLGALVEWNDYLTVPVMNSNRGIWQAKGYELLNSKKSRKKNNPAIKVSREARTKTLAQLGGHFSLTNVLEKFNLKLSDDLQLDYEAKAKSAVMLGSLYYYFNNLEMELEENRSKWKEIGFKLMKNWNEKKRKNKIKKS